MCCVRVTLDWSVQKRFGSINGGRLIFWKTFLGDKRFMRGRYWVKSRLWLFIWSPFSTPQNIGKLTQSRVAVSSPSWKAGKSENGAPFRNLSFLLGKLAQSLMCYIGNLGHGSSSCKLPFSYTVAIVKIVGRQFLRFFYVSFWWSCCFDVF